MTHTGRELWMVVHVMGLGATFLLAYAGGLAGLWSLHPGDAIAQIDLSRIRGGLVATLGATIRTVGR